MAELANSGLPPGPLSPALLQTLRMLRSPYRFLSECHRRYGDWFTVKLIPCGKLVYVADPAAVREIFANPSLLAGAVNDYMTPVLGHGLLTLDGERHAMHRRWIAPAFSSERVRGYADLVTAEAAREIETWPLHEPFPLRKRFEGLALRVVRQVLLGDDGEELESLILRLKRPNLLATAVAEVGRRLRLPGEAARLVRTMNELLLGLIAARREALPRADVLSWLLSVRLEDGSPFRDDELRDEILTLIFAGHETVATTLSWLFERVLRHPEIHERLREGPEDERYLDAVIKETMRSRSSLPDVGRKLNAPLSLGPWRFPAGTQVFPAMVPLHLRADLYPEPERFRPERFLGVQPEPWAFLPFGGGPRRCVGAAFAMLEMRIITRTVLARTRLRPAGAAPERGVGNGVTIGPHRGALVVMEERRPQ